MTSATSRTVLGPRVHRTRRMASLASVGRRRKPFIFYFLAGLFSHARGAHPRVGSRLSPLADTLRAVTLAWIQNRTSPRGRPPLGRTARSRAWHRRRRKADYLRGSS